MRRCELLDVLFDSQMKKLKSIIILMRGASRFSRGKNEKSLHFVKSML